MVRLRNAEIFSSSRQLRFSPETMTSPAVGVSKPAISWMSVVLPEPLGPMIASKLPSTMRRLRFRSACTRSLFSRYSTLTFSRRIMEARLGSLSPHRHLLDADVSILIGRAHGDKMQTGPERAEFDLERFFAVVEHAVLRGKKLPIAAVD